MTSCGRTEGRSLWREMIGLFLYSAAGGTIVAPPDLVRNVDTAFDTPQGVPDSRVGFQYAALCLGSEDGTNSGGVQGSMRHLSAAAKLLQENPSARLLIEGHVGMGAPDEVAQSFSEYRAHVVATWLVEHFAVEEERLLMRGWGKRIAEQAQDSHHPNAAAAKQGYGWAELFIILGSGCGGDGSITYLPARPDYYYAGPTSPPPPPPAPRLNPTSHLIYLPSHTQRPWLGDQPTPLRAGNPFTLQLTEPQHKLLIRRAWASDKIFVHCAAAAFVDLPDEVLSNSPGPENVDGSCVAAVIDRVVSGKDGKDQVWAKALGEVPALGGTISLEPGTNGLLSTTAPLSSYAPLVPYETEAKLAVRRPSHKKVSDAVADTAPERGQAHDRFLHHCPLARCPLFLSGLFITALFLGISLTCGLRGSRQRQKVAARPLRFCPPPQPAAVPLCLASQEKAARVVMVTAVPGFPDTMVQVALPAGTMVQVAEPVA